MNPNAAVPEGFSPRTVGANHWFVAVCVRVGGWCVRGVGGVGVLCVIIIIKLLRI